MEKHIISRFDDELNNLQNMLMEMAHLTETQLHAISTFLRQGESLDILRDVASIDEKVNTYQVDINRECTRLIAKRAPVAVDLRYIISGNRITTDLERIGDECTKVARYLYNDTIDKKGRLWKEIRGTVRLAKQMLTSTVDIIARFDSDAAHRLLSEDEELDANYSSTMRQIISYMLEDSSTITQGIDVLMGAKALERVGDHCINIAEAVIYAVEGEDIRLHNDN